MAHAVVVLSVTTVVFVRLGHAVEAIRDRAAPQAIVAFDVVSPLLIAALFIAAVVAVFVVADGESTWLEGVTLLVLHVLIAAAFWWG